MHSQTITLSAPLDGPLYLWFEPWAEGLAFPAGSTVELHASSPIEGELEVDETSEQTAVYGWAASTLRVVVGGEQVLSFEQPVPDFLDKNKLTMLFGSPPIPTAKERATATHRPWWRFWQ